MKRLTLQTQNHWRYIKDGGAVDLLRVSFHANRFLWAGAVTVAGFGVGFTFWHVTLREWPTHTDLKPQGMEKAP